MTRPGIWLTRTLIAVFATILMLVLCLVLLLGTSFGRDVTSKLVNSLASSDHFKIELSGFDSALGEIVLQRLTLADAEGIWLEAKDLNVDYAFGDLFFAQISSEQIKLQQLNILRKPLPSQETDPSEPGPLIPEIPLLRASIKDISIEQISLGSDILGIRAELALKANVALDDAPMMIKGGFEVLRRDGAAGTIKGNWNIQPDKDVRHLSFQISEPRGGLAARLLDIADLPSLDLSIEGDGLPSDWVGTLALQLDGNVAVEGETRLALADQAQRIRASLDGQLAPLVPSSVLPLVAGKSELRLDIARNNSGVIDVKLAEFSSALSQLRIRGSIDQARNVVDLTSLFILGEEGTEIALALDEAGQPAVSAGRIYLTSQLSGKLDHAVLSSRLDIASLQQQTRSLGPVRIDVQSSGLNLSAGTGPLNVVVQTSNVETGSPALNAMLGSTPSLKSNLELTGGGAMTLESVELAAKALGVNLAGNIGPQQLALDGKVLLSKLELIDPALSGDLLTTLKFEGTRAKPTLSLDLAGRALSVARIPLEDLRGVVEADAEQNARVRLSANYGEAPLNLQLDASRDESGSRRLENISILAPGSEIKGAILIKDNGLATGDLVLNFADLGRLGPLLLQPDLSGSLTGNLQLAESNQAQTIKLKVRSDRLTMGLNRITNLSLDADVTDPANRANVTANLTVGQLIAGGESVKNLAFRVNGQEGLLPFQLSGHMSGQPLRASGTVRQTPTATNIELAQFAANWRGVAASLVQSTTVRLQNGQTILTDFITSIDGGRVGISGSAGEQLALDVSVSNLPLSIANKLAPTGQAVQGRLDASARITGPSSAPNIAWSTRINSLSVLATRQQGLPALGIEANGTLRGEKLSLQSRTSGGGLDLNVSGDVNLDGPRLNLAAKGRLPFTLAAKTLAESGLQLSGSANLDARITGLAGKPDISGSIVTKGARFAEISSGLVIRNLGGTIRLARQTATLENIRGNIGKDGVLSIKGSIGIDAEQGLPVDIKLGISNGTFNHEDILTTSFGADMALSGQLAGRSKVSGIVNLSRTDISIPESLPGSVSPVSVKHKNAQGRIAKQAKDFQPKSDANKGSGAGPSMTLDLTIASPRRIYLRGRGIDAELGGTIQIRGTTSAPHPVGSVSLLRGRMDVLTKRFDFDRGSVAFSGTLDPALDFSASMSDSSATYTVGVGGYASAPEIILSSSPDLPQDEILAKMFFGKELANLSPVQIAQLANAVATLSGVNSGPGVLDRLRNLAGIDNIDVKSDENGGGTKVGVGRYLNDRTYVNVEKGSSAQDGKVTIDLGITDSWKARGEAGQDGRTKAGIFFEKDY